MKSDNSALNDMQQLCETTLLNVSDILKFVHQFKRNTWEHYKYHLFMDGNLWCAVQKDFINLQESLAGFGDTPQDAITDLLATTKIANENYRSSTRKWKCTNCKTEFYRQWGGDSAPCPRCKCGAQYTYDLGIKETLLVNKEL